VEYNRANRDFAIQAKIVRHHQQQQVQQQQQLWQKQQVSSLK
jgi:hypothetical protein